MSQGVERLVQERAIKLWYQVDQELGARIAQGIGLENIPVLSMPTEKAV